MKRVDLAALIARPMAIDLPEEPRCSCGREERGLTDGLCFACERERRGGEKAAQSVAAALADRSGTLAALGVPPVYYETPFEEPSSWPRDLKVSIDLAAWRGTPWSVVLCGNVGVGKSFLAVELLWRNHLPGNSIRSARFVRASRVPGLIYGPNGDRELENLVSVEVLAIDELGLNHQKGAWEALDDLIGQRWEFRRATLATTRWTLREIGRESSAVSAADRLAEGLVVTVEGRSRRRPPVAGPRRST